MAATERCLTYSGGGGANAMQQFACYFHLGVTVFSIGTSVIEIACEREDVVNE
jgi:hypothetical protein